MNANQHYVSQVLLRRFAAKKKIQRYNIKYGKWKETSTREVFSGLGYNQLLAFGIFDDTLDKEFKKIEDKLPAILEALEGIADKISTKLDEEIYKNLFWYCAFLWNMSPFAKAAAPINFVNQLMMNLKLGNVETLKKLGHTEANISAILKFSAAGYKFIITGKNYLQLVYRLQFAPSCESTFMQFRYIAKWTLFNSPIELPISDIAIVQYPDPKSKKTWYVLPISPKLVLVGSLPIEGVSPTSTETIIKGGTLDVAAAEDILDVICNSAFLAIASKARIGNIEDFRQRAKEKKIRFNKINMEGVLAAGLKPLESEKDFLITPVKDADSYVKFVRSFVSPP